MKSSIKLGAFSLLMSLGAFTATAKPRHHKMDMSMNKQQVSVIPLRHEPGFAVMVDKQMPARSMVIITNDDESMIFKDVLTDGTTAEKKYNLSKLDAGNYTLEVFSRGHDIKTDFYVYNKSQGKVVFVK
jgi:hypothetical protein